MGLINYDLRAIDELKQSVGGFDDPRVRVGEVALCFRGDDRVYGRILTLLRGSLRAVALLASFLLRIFPRPCRGVSLCTGSRFGELDQAGFGSGKLRG